MDIKKDDNELSRLQRKIKRLSKKVKELPVMHEINRDIASLVKIDEILEIIIDRATSMLKSEVGSILLFDNSHKELVIKAAKGLRDDIVSNTRIPIGEGISGWVAKAGLPLLITDISKNGRFAKKDGKYYTNSLISVPLKIGGEVIGVININNKKNKEIERLRAKGKVKYSKRLEKKIKELETEKNTLQLERMNLEIAFVKCLKEKEILKKNE